MPTDPKLTKALTRLGFKSTDRDEMDDVEEFFSKRWNVGVDVFGNGQWQLSWEEMRTKGKGLSDLLRSIKQFQFKKEIKEMVDAEIEEMTATGDAQGFGTPLAFDPDEESSLDEQFERVVAGINETKNPEWAYKDNQGRDHIGHVQHVSDKGGTDVTYFFIDKTSGELSLLSGSRMKGRAKTTNRSSEPHEKYWHSKELLNSLKKKKGMTEGGDPYYAWRNDETATPKMKIGKAISEINKQLTEMAKVVKRSARLKTEMGVPNSDLWKRTNASLMKIEQRMTGIAQQIRGMRG